MKVIEVQCLRYWPKKPGNPHTSPPSATEAHRLALSQSPSLDPTYFMGLLQMKMGRGSPLCTALNTKYKAGYECNKK